ncbi:MAG TPA: glycosyltransferase family 39 protein [Anaerolineae bacterium]|nr:glycosyltransferase family 39 protein [Anaerolineae bacterium]HQM12937.1 glycosyltransferase family 39 protein [Anaerolineae bacterium]
MHQRFRGMLIMGTKSKVLLIGGIIIIALILRIWGIAYDLPYIYHPDEPVPLGIAYRMLATGDLNPHFFDWSSLIIYINLFIQFVYSFFERIFIPDSSFKPANPLVELAMGVTYSPKPIIVLLGRLVTVAVGICTIVIVISAGKHIFNDLRVGMLAGLMMAIAPTNVALNRYITPDAYATFFMTLVLWASISIYSNGQMWGYILAGIGLGLAVSSKYNAGLIGIVILTAHFLSHGLRGFKDWRLYLTVFLAVLAFAITTPYSWLDFHTFLPSFLSTGTHYATGHPGMEGNTLHWYFSYMWRTAGIIYPLAALSIIRGWIPKPSEKIVLLSLFPVVYFAFISNFIVRNDRTFLPLTPFLFLLASELLAGLFDSIKSLPSQRWQQLAFLGLTCLLAISLVVPAKSTFADTVQLTTMNSRETARVWIEQNLPAGSKIAIESYSPFVNPARFKVSGFVRIIDFEPEWYIQNGFDYLVFSQGMYGRFYRQPEQYPTEVAKYDEFFNDFMLVRLFTDGNYEVRIYALHRDEATSP